MNGIIQQCREFVEKDSVHNLDITLRRELWLSFGERLDRKIILAGVLSEGHRKRASLMLGCVRKVLPLYEAENTRSGNNLVNLEDHPARILEAAERRLNGQDTWDETRAISKRFGTMLQYLSEIDSEYPVAALILSAAGSAISATLFDITWIEGDNDESQMEAWTADTESCWAFCNGIAPWDEQNNRPEINQRRCEFWMSYLNEAHELAE